MRLLAKNLGALLCSQAATWAVSLVMLILLPRYLGDAQFGQLNFAWAFTGFFGMIAGLGSGQFMTKEIARDNSRLGQYVFNDLAMKVPLLTFLSLAAIGLAHLLQYSPETCLLVSVSCLAMFLGILNGSLVAGLQGEQRIGRTAAVSVVERYANTAAVVAALAARKGLVIIALASACTGLISVLGNGAQLYHRLREGARIDLRLWKTLALGGSPFLLWNIALTVYGNIDILLLSLLTSDAVVGWYVLAYKLISVPGFLPTLVIAAFFPALSALGKGDSVRFARLANGALKMSLLVTAPMAAGIALTATDVITFLHYPAPFLHSVPLVRILALHVPLGGLDTVLGTIIIASDRQKQWVIVGCLAAITNPLLNLAMIPATTRIFGDGAIGASVVTVVTEVLMLGGAVYLRPAGVLDSVTINYLLRCLLACVPMMAAVWLAADAGLFLRVLLGALVYGLGSLLLRILSVREMIQAGDKLFRSARVQGASSAS